MTKKKALNSFKAVKSANPKTKKLNEYHLRQKLAGDVYTKSAMPAIFMSNVENQQKYRVVHGGLLAIWHRKERPICQVKLHRPKKRFFVLFLLGRVEISVSFIQNVVEN
jgi:hypothetical protein